MAPKLSKETILRIATETDFAAGGYPGTKWLYEFARRLELEIASYAKPCSKASRCKTAQRDRALKDKSHREESRDIP